MQIIWMFIWMVVIQRHEHWTFQKQLVIAQVWCMHLLSSQESTWSMWSMVEFDGNLVECPTNKRKSHLTRKTMSKVDLSYTWLAHPSSKFYHILSRLILAAKLRFLAGSGIPESMSQASTIRNPQPLSWAKLSQTMSFPTVPYCSHSKTGHFQY
jgi:hypothetical protein